MKILVIAPARTSSTALAVYLAQTKGNLINFNEELSIGLEFEYNVYKTNNFQKLLPILKKELKERLNKIFANNDNFVIKFAGHHLNGLTNYIDIIDPKRFNEIHLLERTNFLDQACSLCIAKTESLWTNNDNADIQKKFNLISTKEKSFLLTENHIFQTAYDCKEYINCKKYLKERNIVYQQHYYEDTIFKSQKVGNLLQTGLDYSKLVKNYSSFNQLNDYFFRYFNYDICKAQFEEFIQSLNVIRTNEMKALFKNNRYKQ